MFRGNLIRVYCMMIGALLATARTPFVTAEAPQTTGGRLATVDQQGDPLPDGALARMGTLRWRHGDTVAFVAFTPGEKSVLTASLDNTLRLWDRATGKEIRRFIAPKAPDRPIVTRNGMPSEFGANLTRAALSSDGKIVAAVLPSDAIQLWAVETGKELRRLPVTGSDASAIVFSPDRKTLAVRAGDRSIRLLDVLTGREIRVFRLQHASVEHKFGIGGKFNYHAGLAFSRDGKAIAAAEVEFTNRKTNAFVRILETDTGKELRRMQAPGYGVDALAFAPNGNILAFASYNSIHLHDPNNGKEIRGLRNAENSPGVAALRFSSDSTRVLAKGRDGIIRIWDARTGAKIRELTPWAGVKSPTFYSGPGLLEGNEIAVTNDGKLVAAAAGPVLCFWDIETGKPVDAAGHGAGVSALVFADDGRTLISRGGDSRVFRWDAATGKEIGGFTEPTGTVCTAISPDGRTVATGAFKGTITLYSVPGGKQLHEIKREADSIASLAFSADGTALASRARFVGDPIRLYNVLKGTEASAIAIPGADQASSAIRAGVPPRNPVAFAPAGSTIAAYSDPAGFLPLTGRPPLGNIIHLVNAATGKLIGQFNVPPLRVVMSLAFSPDGRVLAAEYIDQSVGLWEIASAQERAVFGNPTPAGPAFVSGIIPGNKLNPSGFWQPGALLSTIAFSPDGGSFASCGPGKVVQVWDIAHGKEIGLLKGHDGEVLSVAFSHDSKTLASGSADTTILTWDVARLKRPQTAALELQAGEAAILWSDLAGADATKAYRSMRKLLGVPKQAVALLGEHLKPAVPMDAKKLEHLLADLDSENFRTRTTATMELEKLGELAIPTLQKLLASKPTLELRRRVGSLLDMLTASILTGDRIRIVRAIEVLEKTKTAEACRVLEGLAKGVPGALPTLHAQAALDRLQLRSSSR